MPSGVGTCLQFQLWKAETWNPQGRLPRGTSHIGEFLHWLRDPASKNEVEEWSRMIPDMGIGPLHTCVPTFMCVHTCKNIHIDTCAHPLPHVKSEKRKEQEFLSSFWWRSVESRPSGYSSPSWCNPCPCLQPFSQQQLAVFSSPPACTWPSQTSAGPHCSFCLPYPWFLRTLHTAPTVGTLQAWLSNFTLSYPLIFKGLITWSCDYHLSLSCPCWTAKVLSHVCVLSAQCYGLQRAGV